MASVPFALYDAFSETVFGGSQAAVVSAAQDIDPHTRQQIAREIGAPATAFITATCSNSISARFHSPVTEYFMCGHGTIGLMTHMLEQGVLDWTNKDTIVVDLCLASTTSRVEVHRREDGRALVLLDIPAPTFSQAHIEAKCLADLLGIDSADVSSQWPLEIASGDFVHLIVPLKGLEAMHHITPNFSGLRKFSEQNKIQTIAVFCTQVQNADSDVHMRDFCPAVGVNESAGAGTTNAALSSYLIRHQIMRDIHNKGQIIVQAEQGIEIERPSSICTVVKVSGVNIDRLQVGGVATKVIEGSLYLPNQQ